MHKHKAVYLHRIKLYTETVKYRLAQGFIDVSATINGRFVFMLSFQSQFGSIKAQAIDILTT